MSEFKGGYVHIYGPLEIRPICLQSKEGVLVNIEGDRSHNFIVGLTGPSGNPTLCLGDDRVEANFPVGDYSQEEREKLANHLEWLAINIRNFAETGDWRIKSQTQSV